MKILVTGSSGLVGFESVSFFCNLGYEVIGIDNDFRGHAFGKSASVIANTKMLLSQFSNFKYFNVDIRNYEEMLKIFKKFDFQLIIHTAGQPSHDWSAKHPLIDFEINAFSTVNLLNLTKETQKDVVFIFTSTNKVYGDKPNYLSNLIELDSRFECFDVEGNLYAINENFGVDNSLHSPFGVSKLSADLMCQEFSKYFDMKIGVFRCGCITGAAQQGTELHGFLSYLVNTIKTDSHYEVHGFKGKQVRDNLHAKDLVKAFYLFFKNPKNEIVYNMGGGRGNEISIIEAINKTNNILDKNWNDFKINNNNRTGDHIWYVSDISKFKRDYPEWNVEFGIDKIIEDLSS